MPLLGIYTINENIYSYNNLYTHVYSSVIHNNQASQVALVVKDPSANAGDVRDEGLIRGREDLLEEEVATHSVFLPGESYGERCLVGYSP